MLSKDGISVDESKVEVITTFPTPQNTQQLRSFLGIASYYKRFIMHFSMKTAHLRSLLKRDAKFIWNSAHEQEFKFSKNALTTAPILAFPNMQKEFILTTVESPSYCPSWMIKAENTSSPLMGEAFEDPR